MANYSLKCLHPDCGKTYQTDPDFRVKCEEEIKSNHGPALLQPIYQKSQIDFRKGLPGVFGYSDWLPTGPYYLEIDDYELGKPFCYKSEGLAKRLGLKELFIAFSGFWPERGPKLLTRSFKQFEAQTSLVRYLNTVKQSENPPALLVSSAGNTANGYNLLAHFSKLPLYLVVPLSGLEKLILPFPTNPFVIAVEGDYSDAIQMAYQIESETGLKKDGGVRNVARRAGLGTVMLNAVCHPKQGTGKLYNHYFQAIGSGAGAIAAWEAIQLLLKDGRFGETITQVHVAQNYPYAPVPASWKNGKREAVLDEERLAKEKIAAVTADVLTTREPCYSPYGGLYDVLKGSKGDVWETDNHQVFHGARMFRECEGVDIGPAAAVAVDALRQAVQKKRIKPKDRVLLHITGGGREIQLQDEVFGVQPKVCVKPNEIGKALSAIQKPQTLRGFQKLIKNYGEIKSVSH